MNANINLRLKLIADIADSFHRQAKNKSDNNIVKVASDSLIIEMDAIKVLCDLNNLEPERNDWFADLDDDGNTRWTR